MGMEYPWFSKWVPWYRYSLDFAHRSTPCTHTTVCGYSTGKLQWVIINYHIFTLNFCHFFPSVSVLAMALVLWQFWVCLVINTLFLILAVQLLTYIYILSAPTAYFLRFFLFSHSQRDHGKVHVTM